MNNYKFYNNSYKVWKINKKLLCNKSKILKKIRNNNKYNNKMYNAYIVKVLINKKEY